MLKEQKFDELILFCKEKGYNPILMMTTKLVDCFDTMAMKSVSKDEWREIEIGYLLSICNTNFVPQ